MFVFRYLVAGCFWLCCCVVGHLLIRWWRTGESVGLGFGVASLVALVATNCMVVSAKLSGLELNPVIPSDAAVVGRWEAAYHPTVILQADHRFRLVERGSDVGGSWQREDWNLYLAFDSGNRRQMRFIEDGDRIRLLTNPPSDWDAWNGDLGLTKR